MTKNYVNELSLELKRNGMRVFVGVLITELVVEGISTEVFAELFEESFETEGDVSKKAGNHLSKCEL